MDRDGHDSFIPSAKYLMQTAMKVSVIKLSQQKLDRLLDPKTLPLVCAQRLIKVKVCYLLKCAFQQSCACDNMLMLAQHREGNWPNFYH